MSFGSHMDFTKKIPSLASLLVFIVFIDSLRVKNCM